MVIQRTRTLTLGTNPVALAVLDIGVNLAVREVQLNVCHTPRLLEAQQFCVKVTIIHLPSIVAAEPVGKRETRAGGRAAFSAFP
jgi:hypothetical protein